MKKAFSIFTLILIAFLTLFGCEQGQNPVESNPGKLKLFLSTDALSIIDESESVTVYIRTGSSTGTIIKPILLSRETSSVTTELNPGTYFLTVSTKSLTVATSVVITSEQTSSVSLNPITKGKVKFILPNDVQKILSGNYYSLKIEVRKTLSSAPLSIVAFSNISSASQIMELEKGTYYLSYTFEPNYNHMEFSLPETVTVVAGEVTEITVNSVPKGTVNIQLSSDAASLYLTNLKFHFFSDPEKTDLVSSFDYYTHSTKTSLDPGTYYVSYICDNGDPLIIDDSVTVVNGMESSLNVRSKENLGKININNILKNNTNTGYIPLEYKTIWTRTDSEDNYSYTKKGDGYFYAEKGTYSVKLENDPDITGMIVALQSDSAVIDDSSYKEFVVNSVVVGSVCIGGIGFDDASLKLTFEKNVNANESEVNETCTVQLDEQKIYLPVGDYFVTGFLNSDDEYLDFRLPSDKISLYHKKNVNYQPEVFRTGALELSLTEDFYEKLDKLSVVVHLYRNGEYYEDRILNESTKDNLIWYLPEGFYTYVLEYDEDLMSMSFESDSFDITYADTVKMNCSSYSFADCIAVDIQNKIPGATKINYYLNREWIDDDFYVTFKVQNYPSGAVIRWYIIKDKPELIHEGEKFVNDQTKNGIDFDSLQLRIYLNNQIIDVQQIGNIW